MTVIAVRGDALVAFFCGGLKAYDNCFLTNVEVAKAANQSHSVQLTCLFLEPPDQQHVLVIGFQLIC